MPSKNPSKKALPLKNLLRTLLRVARGCMTPWCAPYPDLPFLAFLEFLVFFSCKEFLAFFEFFPSFPRSLGVRLGRNILAFSVVSLAFYRKKSKEGKIRVETPTQSDRGEIPAFASPMDAGAISFEAVKFRYPFRADVEVLKGAKRSSPCRNFQKMGPRGRT